MTTAYLCVLIAAFMPLIWVGVAKAPSGLKYDNSAPRAFAEKLSGYRQRAYWAHLNSFEAFPPFAAAVVIAHQLHFAQGRLDQLAMGFIAFRLVYGVLYIADRSTLRSVAWFGAVCCWVAMFFIGA